jgi:hypothetical protein
MWPCGLFEKALARAILFSLFSKKWIYFKIFWQSKLYFPYQLFCGLLSCYVSQSGKFGFSLGFFVALYVKICWLLQSYKGTSKGYPSSQEGSRRLHSSLILVLLPFLRKQANIFLNQFLKLLHHSGVPFVSQ